jgi:hypothetical protein
MLRGPQLGEESPAHPGALEHLQRVAIEVAHRQALEAEHQMGLCLGQRQLDAATLGRRCLARDVRCLRRASARFPEACPGHRQHLGGVHVTDDRQHQLRRVEEAAVVVPQALAGERLHRRPLSLLRQPVGMMVEEGAAERIEGQ